MKFVLTRYSWHVCRRALHPRFRHTLLHHRRFFPDGRTCISKRTTHHDISLQRPLVRRLAHSSRSLIRYPKSQRRLGLAHTLAPPSRPITTPNHLHLVITLSPPRSVMKRANFFQHDPRIPALPHLQRPPRRSLPHTNNLPRRRRHHVPICRSRDGPNRTHYPHRTRAFKTLMARNDRRPRATQARDNRFFPRPLHAVVRKHFTKLLPKPAAQHDRVRRPWLRRESKRWAQ